MSLDRVGLDTSVVIRLLTGEPADQHLLARQHLETLLANGSKIVVADLVILEAYFCLQTSYGLPKLEALKALESFLNSGWVATEPGTIVKSGIFQLASKAGLGDRLIAHRYESCADQFLTFDRAMSRLGGGHLVAPNS